MAVDKKNGGVEVAAAAEFELKKARDYHKKVDEMNSRLIEAHRLFMRFEESGNPKERKPVENFLDLETERVKLIAEFFGGTVTRLAEAPDDLKVEPEKRPFLVPEDQLANYPKLTTEDQPFLRMDVKGRTYLFFLPRAGVVNVYTEGKYKGGNNDLAFFEIFEHLKDNGWFGVIGS